MALLQKIKFVGNERVDLKDVNSLQDFVCADFKEIHEKVWSETTQIINGFELYQDQLLTNSTPTVSPIYLNIVGSTVMHTGATSGPEFYIGPETETPLAIQLTNSVTNYVELALTEVLGAEDSRAIWDATANNNEGEEFIQVIDTAKFIEASVSISTSGFTAGNKIPIAEIVVNSLGIITAIYDRRNLFFRLGRGFPYNANYQYPFTNGRRESIHNVVLEAGDGFYLHYQPTPSTVWTIVHNLGVKYVIPKLYDLNGTDITPLASSIVATSTSTLTVTFGVAQTGIGAIELGSAGNYFSHTQGGASGTWTVTHNLGFQYVNFAFYDASDILLTPSTMTATNSNSCVATFGGTPTGHGTVSKGNANGRFTYTNGAASTSWVVPHNLGYKFGTIEFYNVSNLKITPTNISVTDANNITVTFAGSEDGQAVYLSDNGGTYISEETVSGNTSGTSARVVANGTTTLQIYSKIGNSFTIGETLVAQTTGSSRKIVSVKESFFSADKEISTLKKMLDALMSEIARIKFGAANRQWFEDSTFSLLDIGGGSGPTTVTSLLWYGGGTISWNSGTSLMTFTADFSIPIPGTGFTNAIQVASSPIIIAANEVVFVDVDTGSSANLTPQIANIGAFVNTANRFIIAARFGTDLYLQDRLISIS